MRGHNLLGLAVLSLAACGGGGGSEPDRYQQAVDQANQTEATARALGGRLLASKTSSAGS